MGWGWGESSYMRNVQIENNSITKPMQLLSDGGGVYTNTPCPDCHGTLETFSDGHQDIPFSQRVSNAKGVGVSLAQLLLG